MKKVVFFLMLLISVCHLKAQQLFHLKPTDGLQLLQSDSITYKELGPLNKGLIVFNGHTFKDAMPVAKLEGYSNMPIAKLEGFDKMSILYIGAPDIENIRHNKFKGIPSFTMPYFIQPK